MSAMAKMFTDMIMKELPDEIREALTPDNMERVARGVGDKWKFIEASLNTIVENQKLIMERLEIDNGSNRSGTSDPLAIADGNKRDAA